MVQTNVSQSCGRCHHTLVSAAATFSRPAQWPNRVGKKNRPAPGSRGAPLMAPSGPSSITLGRRGAAPAAQWRPMLC